MGGVVVEIETNSKMRKQIISFSFYLLKFSVWWLDNAGSAVRKAERQGTEVD